MYLSVVACSRNDDHGGDMHRRMQVALSSFISQAERYKLKSEVVLVDYNPPPDRPLLKDSLIWPEQTDYCTVRTIVVPPSIHRRYKDSDKLSFNGAIAQNVGLRRAKGKFVLLTPVDNLFSNELIDFIAKHKLQERKLYRTDRLDVSRRVMEITSVDERLAFCRENIIWIHSRYGSIPVVRKKNKHLRSKNIDFSKKEKEFPRLHTNGPDLLLMSKKSWHSLRGFLEIDTLGLHLDSLLCYTAYLKGIEEEIMPDQCCIYHIDHDSLWRNIQLSLWGKILYYCLPDEVAFKLQPKIEEKLIPIISYEKSKLASMGIKHLNSNDIFRMLHEIKNGVDVSNDNKWGLGNEMLEEYLIL